MSLIKCPECGRKNVSDTAAACPNCGFNISNYYQTQQAMPNNIPPQNPKKSNKGLIIGIIVALVIIIGVITTVLMINKAKEKVKEEEVWVEVNYSNITGSWKLQGNPDVYYTFEPYDGNKGFATASTRNDGEDLYQMYHYIMQDEGDGNDKLLLMQPVDVGGYKAGEVICHSNTQLIALPIIPKIVKEEMENSKKYYEIKERCLFCDIMSQEIKDKKRGLTSSLICFIDYIYFLINILSSHSFHITII